MKGKGGGHEIKTRTKLTTARSVCCGQGSVSGFGRNSKKVNRLCAHGNDFGKQTTCVVTTTLNCQARSHNISMTAKAPGARQMLRRPAVHLLRLSKAVGIKDQLRLEEALLRHDTRNWCLLKDGEPAGDMARPTIVLGIGGKAAKLVELERVNQDRVPLVRRFSGGGTVIVDQDSLFITFIMNTEHVTPKQPYPRPIMEWTAGVYGPVFDRLRTTQTKPFALRENDYVFGPLKFGGNAQSIVKDRWLHHTSFLWDFQRPNMDYLTLPERRPEYRQDRSHGSFLTRLKEHTLQQDRAALFRELEVELAQHFDVHAADEAEVRAEVIEGKLGGMVAWAEKARTRDVSTLEELTKHVEQLQQTLKST